MAIKRMLIVVPACVVLSLSGPLPAIAHAQLIRAVSAAGGTLHAAPSEVTLRFSEKLEPSFSSVVVRDSTGKQIDKGDGKVDKRDRMVIRASLPYLEPAFTRSSGRRCRRTPTRSAAILPSRSANNLYASRFAGDGVG
jgi:methionine-rich copper-binding protein CopC